MTAPSAPVAPPSAAKPAGDSEQAALLHLARLKRRIEIQGWAIAALATVLAVILPFAAPAYIYYARKPNNQIMRMVGLDMPNMTDRAVLSWATTSVTEIMTMGFGDMDVRLPRQRWRFTEDGWNAYTKAFVRDKI
ncbi:MAG: DotI/IcmL/TraM family protein, partial [Alphaproteobacteria bacterium]|nr:DotI/IcmL/TraM family protein [Alphaproteobacteria bacterium]